MKFKCELTVRSHIISCSSEEALCFFLWTQEGRAPCPQSCHSVQEECGAGPRPGPSTSSTVQHHQSTAAASVFQPFHTYKHVTAGSRLVRLQDQTQHPQLLEEADRTEMSEQQFCWLCWPDHLRTPQDSPDSQVWCLTVWSLHILPVSVWTLSRFLPQSKNSNSKLAVGVNVALMRW